MSSEFSQRLSTAMQEDDVLIQNTDGLIVGIGLLVSLLDGRPVIKLSPAVNTQHNLINARTCVQNVCGDIWHKET